ncbi:DUF4062 domain-containing protein [Marinomonas spartinae]|uniref:DUF4062 domain-containing protein n=1 Tax=Marinomonas spartinae TaxID=1792290 RepID=UPI0018F172AA|nr:DUF4062 domain-containing protein [Marinomonas spartinae]MBJ7554503.1 DUF4062 domain-containing protein [Marinomonas spartinae]
MKSTKYQVFLSSTYSDLADERENIIKAILEMYHIPIGMEMFSAEDEDQWEIIRRTIEVSDYYILILGLRYGSKTSDGISFTQKEYEYALEKKIPILAFVMNDTVSLSRNKRDDDLSDINKFRELVLTNSKMAQFWETKDQLIKSVSISLMKQIMQKPGVGWIRGDTANTDEALSKELSALSKENRELRERVAELESKISLKAPVIELDITQPVVDDNFDSYEKVVIPVTLSMNDVDAHLSEFISEEDIENYNNTLPSQSEIDEYNIECEKIFRIKNYSVPLEIEVSNGGTTKANNVYIDIEFSEGLYIYENDEKYSEPKSPIPFNPLNRAQSEYRKQSSATSLLHSQLGIGSTFAQLSNLTPAFNRKRIRPINQKWWTKLDGQKITVKVDNLLHTRRMVFDDEYMIVPLKSGKHTIDIQIICEEYGEVETNCIEFEI